MNEKLDFTILADDGMLEASIYNNDKVRIGHFHIFSNENFNVIAYISSKYSEIKKDCKDIYEALDVANQWWNKNKNLYLETWEKITKNKYGKILKIEKSDGYFCEYTYNELGQELTYKDSTGFWREYTYNQLGKQLTYKSDRFSNESTYNEKGLLLTHNASDGFWQKYTYNEFGQVLTFENSRGRIRKHTYNDEGQVLTSEIDGFCNEYIYDDKGRIIYEKTFDGIAEFSYDDIEDEI